MQIGTGRSSFGDVVKFNFTTSPIERSITMNYYKTEKINDSLTAIKSRTGEIMYLAEGRDHAALIDTCVGVGHLKGLVDNLTDRPVTVLLTHGQIDHAMGAPEFEKVYMNEKDREIYRGMCPVEARRGYIRNGIGEKADQIPESEFVPANPDYPFLSLEDGMVFDLGGLHIEAYEFPGHTPGKYGISDPGDADPDSGRRLQ